MTPLQPGKEHRADRDDRGGAYADRDADDLLPAQAVTCHAALSHFAKCRDCFMDLRALMLAAQLGLDIDDDAIQRSA